MIDTPSLAKFSAFVQLKDFRAPTKKEYVRYVRPLGDHYQCDPATLTEDQVRAYFLFLRQHKQFGGSAMKLAKCALRAFFRDCLHLEGWTVFGEVRIAPPQTLPLVLPREQVATVLRAVREPRLKMVLAFIYHTGLRVGEAVRVELRDLKDTHKLPQVLQVSEPVRVHCDFDVCAPIVWGIAHESFPLPEVAWCFLLGKSPFLWNSPMRATYIIPY